MLASQELTRRVENIRFKMDTGSSGAENYVEVENEGAAANKEKIFITGINGLHSTVKIAQRMRERRSIVLLSIRELAKNEEFRPCIERVKKDCRDNNYEMAVIDNEWIMMIPKDSGIELVS